METLKNRRFLVSRKSLISAKLSPNAVAFSLGITAAILYIACIILIAILPLDLIVRFLNSTLHSIDFSGIARKDITLIGSITGIIGWALIATVTGYIFAFVYNWLIGRL